MAFLEAEVDLLVLACDAAEGHGGIGGGEVEIEEPEEVPLVVGKLGLLVGTVGVEVGDLGVLELPEVVAVGALDAVDVAAVAVGAVWVVAPEVIRATFSGWQPFLRVADGSVWANVHSPSWHRHTVLSSAMTASSVSADPSLTPRWEQVAGATTFAWLDERALGPTHAPPADPSREQAVATWTLPVEHDGAVVAIAGTTRWLPFAGEIRERPAAGDAWTVAAAATGLSLLGIGWLRRHRRVVSRVDRT